MRYKSIICDDEKLMTSRLLEYTDRLEKETGLSISTSVYHSAEEMIERMDEDTDVILLDISMGKLSGMDAARMLRKRGIKSRILFITSMLEYAVEGYDVHAFAFLPKPVNYETFRQKMLECFESFNESEQPVLQVKTAAGDQIVPVNDLLFAEIYQHESSLHTNEAVITGMISISALEDQLKEQGFYRCHRSYLVNMAKIVRIGSNELVLSNGKRIPLSKHRKKDFLQTYASFMGGRFL